MTHVSCECRDSNIVICSWILQDEIKSNEDHPYLCEFFIPFSIYRLPLLIRLPFVFLLFPTYPHNRTPSPRQIVLSIFSELFRGDLGSKPSRLLCVPIDLVFVSLILDTYRSHPWTNSRRSYGHTDRASAPVSLLHSLHRPVPGSTHPETFGHVKTEKETYII